MADTNKSAGTQAAPVVPVSPVVPMPAPVPLVVPTSAPSVDPRTTAEPAMLRESKEPGK